MPWVRTILQAQQDTAMEISVVQPLTMCGSGAFATLC